MFARTDGGGYIHDRGIRLGGVVFAGTSAVLVAEGEVDIEFTGVVEAFSTAMIGIEQDDTLGVGEIDMEADFGFVEVIDLG